MKLFALVTTTALLATQTLALNDRLQSSAYDFSGWTQQDLKDYVNDHMNNLEDSSQKSWNDLKKEASQIWNDMAERKPWWQAWKWGGGDSGDSGNHRYVLPWIQDAAADSRSSVSSWLFDSWSADTLRNFIRTHKIDLGLKKMEDTSAGVTVDESVALAKMSKDAMISKLKANFDQVSKSLKSSGYYPSTAYFRDWTVEDLQNWLNEHGIKYTKQQRGKPNREELVRLVRRNIYKVSKELESQRMGTIESLKLANKQLMDKAGQVKANVFDSWSKDDLEDWLLIHKIALERDAVESRDSLIKLAKQNAHLLQDDIAWYYEKSKQNFAKPMAKKTEGLILGMWQTLKKYTGMASDKSSEFIDDTFLVNIESWPKDKLKSFLDIRDVSYPYFATKRQLIDLVVAYRNKQITGNLREKFDNARDWTIERKDQMRDSKAYDMLTDQLSKISDGAGDISDKLMSIFNNWKQEDLMEYLKGYGVAVSEKSPYTKDELVKKAQEYTSLFLFHSKQPPFYSRIVRRVGNTLKGAYYFIFNN